MDRRPWGWFLTVISVPGFWAKLIYVRPDECTSLQFHEQRSELHVSANGIFYYPRRTIHRMEEGLYLELAFGNPIESDIKRISDKYDRT